MDKYLNTKQGSLEESVLEIWKEAAIEEDFRMDGRTKAYKEHRARLEAARIRREGIKKSIQTEESPKSGGKEEYEKFFNAAMKKFGVSSPAELKGDKEKEFYNYIDKNWKGDHEEGLEDSPNAANSQHLCAKNVVHEEWGNGECIPTMHAEPDEEGNIGWYDVMFEHGLEKGVAINELKVTHSEMHHNHKKKDKVKEGVVGNLAKAGAKAVGRAAKSVAKKAGQKVMDKTGVSKAISVGKKVKDTASKVGARVKKAAQTGEEFEESYEMGTDEYRKHTQSITPGQDVTDFQNFKVESMREALAKVWEKAGLDEKVEYVEYKFKNKNDAAKAKAMLDAVQLMSFDINDDDITNGELVVDAGNKDMTKYHKQIMQKFSPKVLTQENELEEYITKDGMRRRVAEGDKRRTENKDTGKGGKTMTGKTSDVINLKPSTDSK